MNKESVAIKKLNTSIQMHKPLNYKTPAEALGVGLGYSLSSSLYLRISFSD